MTKLKNNQMYAFAVAGLVISTSSLILAAFGRFGPPGNVVEYLLIAVLALIGLLVFTRHLDGQKRGASEHEPSTRQSPKLKPGAVTNSLSRHVVDHDMEQDNKLSAGLFARNSRLRAELDRCKADIKRYVDETLRTKFADKQREPEIAELKKEIGTLRAEIGRLKARAGYPQGNADSHSQRRQKPRKKRRSGQRSESLN